MSGETLTPIELIEHAEDVVNELCQGKRKWRMSVPARPDHDPDLVIGRGLQAGRDALAEVRRLREALTVADEALRNARAAIATALDAAR